VGRDFALVAKIRQSVDLSKSVLSLNLHPLLLSLVTVGLYIRTLPILFFSVTFRYADNPPQFRPLQLGLALLLHLHLAGSTISSR
jgi:hypothetical protein